MCTISFVREKGNRNEFHSDLNGKADNQTHTYKGAYMYTFVNVHFARLHLFKRRVILDLEMQRCFCSRHLCSISTITLEDGIVANSGKLFTLANGSGLMKMCWLFAKLTGQEKGKGSVWKAGAGRRGRTVHWEVSYYQLRTVGMAQHSWSSWCTVSQTSVGHQSLYGLAACDSLP